MQGELAGVAELADALDSKSSTAHTVCGFESHLRHVKMGEMENKVCYVYALLSLLDGSIYVGMTDDLARRLREHWKGWVRSTRDRRPLEILHVIPCASRKDARRLEVYLKSGEGRLFLKMKISQPLSAELADLGLSLNGH